MVFDPSVPIVPEKVILLVVCKKLKAALKSGLKRLSRFECVVMNNREANCLN